MEKRKRTSGRETRERFYRPLMPFHPLPPFCGRNTKNLTFPSSVLPLSHANSSIFPLTRVLRSFFPTSASRAIFPRSGRCATSSFLRDKFLQLEPANDGYRQVPAAGLFGRDKSYFFPCTDLSFPFVFSFPSLSSPLLLPRSSFFLLILALTYHM